MGKPISESTLRELKARAKSLKTAMTLILIVTTLLIAWVIYRLVAGEKVLIAAMVPCIMVILCGLFPIMSTLGKIKKEVEMRLNK